MPCYEVRTVTVEFQAKNEGLFLKAVEMMGMQCNEVRPHVFSLGYNDIVVDLNTQTARATGQQTQNTLNRLKRTYSQAAIDAVCRQNLWTKKQQTATSGVLMKF